MVDWEQLYTGAPAWQNKDWPAHLQGGLAFYSQHFNSVEGNTTFYALPTEELVHKWDQDTPEHFRFCFKFPSEISHQKKLKNCQKQTNEFLSRIKPLQPKLGPFMLQLAPEFSPIQLSDLFSFIDSLPTELPLSVEVRHPGFFDKSASERQLNSFLRDRHIARVCYDSRPLFEEPETIKGKLDKENLRWFNLELERKPSLPVRPYGFSAHPVIRIMASPHVQNGAKYLEQWLPSLKNWLENGQKPYLFLHVPNERYVPDFANVFRNLVNLSPINRGRGQSELF